MSVLGDPEIYRTILESLQTGVCVLDLEKTILFWNNGAERITGYSGIEVLGQSRLKNILLFCNHENCVSCAEPCPLTAGLHQGKSSESEIFVHHKAGHRTAVTAWTIPLRDERGVMVGLIQTFEPRRHAMGSDLNEQSLQASGCLDAPTGLANHLMMESHLRETLGTFAELHVPFSLLCLRAPEFDLFRGKYGKDAATSILRVLGRNLKNALWPTDFVGRWKEDQFLVILHGCGEAALQSVCERIQRTVANATIEWWGEELSLPISIGRTTAQSGDTEQSLLARVQKQLQENSASPRQSAATACNNSTSSSS